MTVVIRTPSAAEQLADFYNQTPVPFAHAVQPGQAVALIACELIREPGSAGPTEEEDLATFKSQLEGLSSIIRADVVVAKAVPEIEGYDLRFIGEGRLDCKKQAAE